MGLMRNIVIVEYSPDWPAAFAAEAARIAEALGPVLIEIHHIGSTSVPGLAAKPLIDVLPVVRSLEELDARNAVMKTRNLRRSLDMANYAGKIQFSGADEHRAKLLGILHEFARDNGLHLEVDVQERLWPVPQSAGVNPPVPLANNEITDGPFE